MTDDTETQRRFQEQLVSAESFFKEAGETAPQYTIKQEIIDRWLAIDGDQLVTLRLTRSDVDHLYFAIMASHVSLIGFQMSMVAWTQGNADAANIYYKGCVAKNTQAAERLQKFMEAVMKRAEPADE